MKTRMFACLLACLLVFGLVPGAMATEPAETTEVTKPVRGEFECGDELTWAYEDGVLTITGQGEMDDYEEDAPWAKYKDEMEAVILIGDVTYIGARAFKDYDELESVDFGDKLYEIGEEAFWSCEGLEEIELPASFKVFGPSSFVSCKNLTEIHCEGKFPSFRQNCFWDTYATIYFPAERPWSVSLIQQLEEAFHGRIEFLASDGSDPYVPTEATEPAPETEVPTEAPTEMPTETTIPETEATVVVTEPPVETTEQVTEAPTQAPTEATQPETEEPEGDSPMKLIAIGFGAALGLGLLAGIALMLRQLKRKGKYSN